MTTSATVVSTRYLPECTHQRDKLSYDADPRPDVVRWLPMMDICSRAGHLVLLGDSVFDNGAYISAGPDVATQLRLALPARYKVTLLARDGAVAADLPHQIARLPDDASHMVVSVGGNDALCHLGVLDEPAGSMAEALERLARIRQAFRADYRDGLIPVVRLGLPICSCTIYDPRFPDPLRQRAAEVALSVFNDIITRAAAVHGLGLLDLRVLFNKDDDYANEREPSVHGGGKIAQSIKLRLEANDFAYCGHRAWRYFWDNTGVFRVQMSVRSSLHR